ncbi:MAG: twin-arginine translocase TatA/TatE family subunit [Richelia sp. SM2_1_7]|nr:twin-arginine translocase TatA/TatE family subunit [Richelia sp. SM2_1_7]
MFGLGFPELAVIVVVAIFILDQKNSRIRRALGKTLRGFKEELKNNDDETNKEDDQEQV